MHRFSRYVMSQRYERACASATKALPAYLPGIHEFLCKQKEGGGLYHSYSAYKFLEIWQMLERLHPQTIVECGSGTSTAVFAQYAAANPGTTLVTLEEGAHYIEETRSRLAPEGAATARRRQSLCRRTQRCWRASCGC